MKKKEASEHARALSSLGASKGGKARSASLTPEQKSEIASKAAKARWGNKIPSATHDGVLKIGDAEISCYVLDDGTRIVSTRGIMKALGRTWRGRKYSGTELPVFLEAKNLTPFISNELAAVLNVIEFKPPTGLKGEGFKADILPMICEVYLNARDAGNVLTESQKTVAAQADILMRGFARVGIIALIDEATGYQHDRARDALEKILEAFIKDNLGKWAKRFSDDFYVEIFRLRGVEWPKEKNPPSYIGHLTNDIVYSRLAPGLVKELKEKSPKSTRGNRKNKLHQWLTDDIGHPKLQEHLSALKALMKSCDDWEDFYKRLNRALPKFQELPLWDLAEKKDSEKIIVLEANKKLE